MFIFIQLVCFLRFIRFFRGIFSPSKFKDKGVLCGDKGVLCGDKGVLCGDNV